MFDNLKTDESIQQEADVLGGYSALESDVYDFAINMAYVDHSKSGAMSLNLICKDRHGNNLRQTLWMTSGKDKGCLNYFVDRDGKKQYLPDFNKANAIALLTVGKEISELAPETKVINVYDFDQRKELPKEMPVVTELVGQEITFGVLKQIVDKNIKDDKGNYVPSGETREENVIDKVFRTADQKTVAEIRAEQDTAVFYDMWIGKNRGVTRNRAKGVAAGASTGQTASAAKPKESLFSK